MSDRDNSEGTPPEDCPLPSRRDVMRSRIPNRGGLSTGTQPVQAAAPTPTPTPPPKAADVGATEPPANSTAPTTCTPFPSRRSVQADTGATPKPTASGASEEPKAARQHRRRAHDSTATTDVLGSLGRVKADAGAEGTSVGPTPRRANRAKKAPKWRVALVLILLIAIVGGAAYVALSQIGKGSGTIAQELDFAGPGEGSVEVTITTGELGSEIAQSLVDAGVVKTVAGFTKAFEANSASSTIKPGTYTLKKGMTSAAALAALLDEANRKDNAVTVTAGQTVDQVKEKMVSVGGFSAEAVDAAAADSEAIGLPSVADGDLEGWLAPGSYDVAKDMTAEDIFSQMVAATVKTLEGFEVPEDQWEEVLTKASILEREAGSVEDMPKVARVISNRLEQTDGETKGLLQMDSTVLYGVGKQGGLPAEEDLASDSPYNTYRVKGLPPGPVANPSPAAIEATLNPAEGSWLYFVTVNLDTGETLFTDTLAEQEKNIELLNEWCTANPGKC